MGNKKGKSKRKNKMINEHNQSKRKKKKNSDRLTEDGYDTITAGLYGLEYVAGYTAGGVPYGTPIEDEEAKAIIKPNQEDEIPF